jgi:hypothetical protein
MTITVLTDKLISKINASTLRCDLPKNRSSLLAVEEIFLLITALRSFLGPPSQLSNVYRIILSGVKRTGLEADHQPPYRFLG